MTPQQQRKIQIALGFCRDRLNLPKKGALDYAEAARQIAALPDVATIRELVAWVVEYEQAEAPPPQMKP